MAYQQLKCFGIVSGDKAKHGTCIQCYYIDHLWFLTYTAIYLTKYWLGQKSDKWSVILMCKREKCDHAKWEWRKETTSCQWPLLSKSGGWQSNTVKKSRRVRSMCGPFIIDVFNVQRQDYPSVYECRLEWQNMFVYLNILGVGWKRQFNFFPRIFWLFWKSFSHFYCRWRFDGRLLEAKTVYFISQSNSMFFRRKNVQNATRIKLGKLGF